MTMMKCLVVLLLCNLHGSSSFGLPPPTNYSPSSILRCSADATGDLDDIDSTQTQITDDRNLNARQRQTEQNTAYITALLSNLEQTLDKYIITGSMPTRRRAYNILQQVKRLSKNKALTEKAERMVKRSGMSTELEPLPEHVDNYDHVPATATEQIEPKQQRVGFGNENRDNNDRRFKNLYQNDNYRVGDVEDASSPEYQPTIIKTGRSSSTSSYSSYSPTTLADEQTGNRINLAEERLKWEQQQQERNERQSLEQHYNTVTNANGIRSRSKNINGSSDSGSDSDDGDIISTASKKHVNVRWEE